MGIKKETTRRRHRAAGRGFRGLAGQNGRDKAIAATRRLKNPGDLLPLEHPNCSNPASQALLEALRACGDAQQIRGARPSGAKGLLPGRGRRPPPLPCPGPIRRPPRPLLPSNHRRHLRGSSRTRRSNTISPSKDMIRRACISLMSSTWYLRPCPSQASTQWLPRAQSAPASSRAQGLPSLALLPRCSSERPTHSLLPQGPVPSPLCRTAISSQRVAVLHVESSPKIWWNGRCIGVTLVFAAGSFVSRPRDNGKWLTPSCPTLGNPAARASSREMSRRW